MIKEKETYAIQGELIFISYLPNELKKGMYFLHTITVGVIDPAKNLFRLDEVPEDPDLFMSLYGAPIEIMIIEPDTKEILVYPDQIGWFDNEKEEDLYPITLFHLNTIINQCDGFCWVQVDDDEETPTLFEGKAIISYEILNEKEE